MNIEILTVEEVALLTRLSELTIRRYIKNGTIPGIKLGGRWRVRRGDIYRLFELPKEEEL